MQTLRNFWSRVLKHGNHTWEYVISSFQEHLLRRSRRRRRYGHWNDPPIRIERRRISRTAPIRNKILLSRTSYNCTTLWREKCVRLMASTRGQVFFFRSLHGRAIIFRHYNRSLCGNAFKAQTNIQITLIILQLKFQIFFIMVRSKFWSRFVHIASIKTVRCVLYSRYISFITFIFPKL